MKRAAVEALPRTTDLFERAFASTPEPRQGEGGPSDEPSTAAVASGYHPPLPIATSASNLPSELCTLLWGWSIVDVLAARAVAEVTTRDFDGEPREALILMLSLEKRPGRYSLEERRRVVELFDRLGVEIDAEVNALVSGGKPFAPAIRRYAALPEPLQKMVGQELLDVKTAERWSEFPQASSAAQELFSKGSDPEALRPRDGKSDRDEGSPPSTTRPRLSFSDRRRLFTMLWEMAQRDGSSDGEFEQLVREVGAATDPLSAARKRRYPKLSELERSFSEVAERSLGGSGVRLSPPPYFEGSRFTVEFSFGSARELAKRLSALSRLQDEADELFELL